jgi:UDP-2,3-diacylglucosamine pyrophosphatase LpxH
MKLHYRTIFISDLHLGFVGCRADALARFLKKVKCDTLYLVGDVIDMWRLRQKWYWPPEHNRVVRRILKLAKKDVKVIYIPGNHDEAARKYTQLDFGGVRVMHHDMHTTADGRKIFITHGDQYDLIVKHARLLSIMGGAAYDILVQFNRYYNRVRGWMGLSYWSLSQYVKQRVKSACTFVSRYEESLLAEARRRHANGVICGHVHKAEVRELDSAGKPLDVAYYNCGDWVEGAFALVEDFDGKIRLIDPMAELAAMEEREAQEAAKHEALHQRVASLNLDRMPQEAWSLQ